MEIDIIEPDYYYHIYNRGNNKEKIFKEDEHYYKFLELSKKYLTQQTDILAYCLLPNHFHFLLFMHDHKTNAVNTQTSGRNMPSNGPINLSLPLSHLFNAYAQWFNKKTGRTGGLFQRPFRRRRITSEEYLKQVIYYIHRNPMHHHLADNPENWKFSSYKTILSDQPTLLKREQVLEWFGDRENFVQYHTMQFKIDGELIEYL